MAGRRICHKPLNSVALRQFGIAERCSPTPGRSNSGHARSTLSWSLTPAGLTSRMSYARAISFFEGESRGKDRPSEGLSGKRWNSCTRVGEERAMSGLRWWVLALGSAMAIAGCASVPTARIDAAASAIDDPSLSPSPTSEAAERAKGLTRSPSDPTERPLGSSETAEETVTGDYDPWEPFNTAMFSFNRKVDRYALKPVAKAWDKIVPDPVERSLKRAFDNLSMPRRLVNNLFQLKLKGAGQELARFGLNTTLGVAGLFDVAKVFGLEASEADTGQTLGRYGVGPGPYLVLPFLPPLTARDGIGFAVDAALDPFTYVIFPVAALAGTAVGKPVDEPAVNLELYENVQESTVDLYSAVRNGYLQRRQKMIDDSRPEVRR